MSIELIGVSHTIKGKRRGSVAFRDVNLHIGRGQRVGLLGKRGSGVDELVDIICGAITPLRGDVRITSEISWPIGETGFLASDRSLATNLRFMARIYEVDEDLYLERVTDVAEVAEHWNDELGACDKEIRWQFAFALGVCLPFNIYLFSSTDAPNKEYREKCQSIIGQLGEECGTVVATAKSDVARQYCDRAFVLDDGRITYYEDIEAAIAHLERLEEKAVPEFGEDDSDEDRDDDALDLI